MLPAHASRDYVAVSLGGDSSAMAGQPAGGREGGGDEDEDEDAAAAAMAERMQRNAVACVLQLPAEHRFTRGAPLPDALLHALALAHAGGECLYRAACLSMQSPAAGGRGPAAQPEGAAEAGCSSTAQVLAVLEGGPPLDQLQVRMWWATQVLGWALPEVKATPRPPSPTHPPT